MESVETLNTRLIDHFGKDSDTGQPMFRIVWSEDEVEKRLVECTDLGVQLLYPEVREVKKYWYLRELYVLERLVEVPEFQVKELAGKRLSYEPLWAYRDDKDQPVRPVWESTKYIIDIFYAALGKKSAYQYVDPYAPENKETRIQKLEEELFGNETKTGDALAYQQGIVVPQNYEKGE